MLETYNKLPDTYKHMLDRLADMSITEAEKQMIKNLTPENLAKYIKAKLDLQNAKHYKKLKVK